MLKRDRKSDGFCGEASPGVSSEWVVSRLMHRQGITELRQEGIFTLNRATGSKSRHGD
jgi:hypothetical protein